MKTIFVDFPVRNYLCGIEIRNTTVRRSLSAFPRLLRKLPVFSKFISNTKERKGWEQECKGHDMVVLFDTYAKYSEYTRKIENVVAEDTRLILYLLNPVFFSDDYLDLSKRWEIWSFDKEDSVKYGFRYGGTFYNPNLLNHPKGTGKNTKSDLLFVGTDKGRKPFIQSIRIHLEREGINCDFRIVDNFRSLLSSQYSREVPYMKLCDLIRNTNAIFDVVQKSQHGLTLRIMEGLLFDKKIVTTNLNIANDIDFADCDNIYILKKDNINGLKAFIKKTSVAYSKELKDKYSFFCWIRRLENNVELE